MTFARLEALKRGEAFVPTAGDASGNYTIHPLQFTFVAPFLDAAYFESPAISRLAGRLATVAPAMAPSSIKPSNGIGKPALTSAMDQHDRTMRRFR
jgi:hypothetical protein